MDQCDYSAYKTAGGWWVPAVYHCDGEKGRVVLYSQVCFSEADAMREGRTFLAHQKGHAPECNLISYSRAPRAVPRFPNYPPGVK